MTHPVKTDRISTVDHLVAPWAARLDAALAALEEGRLDDLSDIRTEYADWFSSRFPSPSDVLFEDTEASGVPITWARPADTVDGRVLLYLHGGGYLVGAPRGYRGLVGRFARKLKARAVIPDYRLAPDAVYPAAIDDNLAVYKALLDEGYDARSIAVSGDSAGGAMCISLMVAAQEAGLPLPAAAVAISPWANLEHTGESISSKSDTDPVCAPEGLRKLALNYLGGLPLSSPLASPVFADVTGLHPVQIQIGEREIMLSDAVRLAEHLASSRVRVNLEVWPDMPHVWHLFSDDLEDADVAIGSATDFLLSHLSSPQDPSSK
ncbi:alpha/beta hydrolase [Streptomyces cadmiisoli]|uniref:alpha/beta hydrolase n=1 Tax=Streptomyces cadmiisoli TaxID=2184053 RepID=UPI003D74EEF6